MNSKTLCNEYRAQGKKQLQRIQPLIQKSPANVARLLVNCFFKLAVQIEFSGNLLRT
jgi:hypothetical protein